MAESAGSEWRELLLEALAATGEALQTKIDAVEGAIFYRLQELESKPDAAAERSDMQEALDAVARLRAKKSGFLRSSGVWAGHSKSHGAKFEGAQTADSSTHLHSGNT
jgi:hypothetical protein